MPYTRVLPRDLFNEASLLKCYGRLWIELDRVTGRSWFDQEEVPRFEVDQDPSSGSLSITNIRFIADGREYPLFRPLNARGSWPLYLNAGDDDIAVFDEHGRLTPEMLLLIGQGVR